MFSFKNTACISLVLVVFHCWVPCQAADRTSDFNDLLDQAAFLNAEGRYRDALSLLSACSQEGENSDRWNYQVARALFGVQRRADAYARLARAISLESGQSEYHYFLAAQLYRDDMLERAEESFRASVTLDPSRYDALEQIEKIRYMRYESDLEKAQKADNFEIITVNLDGIVSDVADFVTIFEMSAGAENHQIGINYPEEGRAEGPQAFSPGADNTFLVTDNLKHRVLRFSRDGEILHIFGHQGRRAGGLHLPFDIAEHDKRGIFVLDDPRVDRRVINYCHNGNYIWERRLNDPGRADSFIQFNRLSLDNSGNLYIYGLTQEGFKTRKFDLEGNYVEDRTGYLADMASNTWKTEGIKLSISGYDSQDRLFRVYESDDFRIRYRALGIIGVEQDHIWLAGLLSETGNTAVGTRPGRIAVKSSYRRKANYGVAEILKLAKSGEVEQIYRYSVTREGAVPHARRYGLKRHTPVLFQVEREWAAFHYIFPGYSGDS